MLKPWVIFLTAFLLVTSIGWTKDKKICASPSAVEKFLSSTNQKRAGSTRYAATAAITVQTTTSGGIVLLDADPELLILSNSFDLRGKAVHFQPALKGRYTYSVDDTQFDGRASQPITLKDDDSFELIFKNFPFPYGKNVYDRCYINSNGNITFEKPDTEPPTAENVVKNIPRIAAFFSDLDPESTGAVLVDDSTDRVIVSWLKVPEF